MGRARQHNELSKRGDIMKKTAIAIATMSLLLTLIVTASGQDRRRRAPQQVGNPFGLGGTVTPGVKNRKPMNLGDTGTHEVGHIKGNRRPTPKGWSFGASNPTVVNNESTGENSPNNRTRAPQPKQMKLGDIKGEVINSQQPTNKFRANRPASTKGRTETVDLDEYRTKRPNRRKR
jgi:hypothetical protein